MTEYILIIWGALIGSAVTIACVMFSDWLKDRKLMEEADDGTEQTV